MLADAASVPQRGRSLHPAWPIVAAALATAVFVAMDAAVKSLAPRYGALQLTYFRFASGSVFAVAIWLWWRTELPSRTQPRLWLMHLARSALLMVTLALYFFALSVLPLAQAITMGYTAPIFTSLLAMALLGERPSRWVWLALVLGATGAVVAMWPELSMQRAPSVASSPALLGLAAAGASAVTFAGVLVLTRHQARVDALPTFLLLQNLMPTLMLAGPAAAAWQPVQEQDWATIAAIGALAGIGLAAITWAYRHQEASRLAPVEYSGLVWAGLFGYLLFGEVPALHTLASAALIVAGCLLLMRK